MHDLAFPVVIGIGIVMSWDLRFIARGDKKGRQYRPKLACI
jgi:hypothetical protein